ncbi:MAG: tyrosine-type recombinase/integrase [Nanoarchaeota archaeon]|nr:tyrosine-type recombinase/integrase [Nanoarchaeota archaeon]
MANNKQKLTKKYNIYYLSMDEINKIISAAKNLRDSIVIKILARTGMRRFELCNLRVGDVDFDKKRIYIPRAKGGKSRSVPIDNNTLKDIKFYIGSRQYGKLIQSNKKNMDGIDESRINEIVRITSERAGIKHPDPTKKNMNPHIFRHSFIRHLLKIGVPPNYVQQMAGHSDIRTTLQMYGIPSFKDIQEKYQELEHTFYENK